MEKIFDRPRALRESDQAGWCGQDHVMNYSEGERAWLDWSNASSANSTDPDRAFGEQWAATIIDAALQLLRTEYRQSRREAMCETLMPYLTAHWRGNLSTDCGQVKLHRRCSQGCVAPAATRFAQAVRQQVQETIDDPRDLETELDELIRYTL